MKNLINNNAQNVVKNLFNNNAQNAVSNLKIKILRVAQDGRMTFWQLISQPLCESQAAQLGYGKNMCKS